MDDLNGLDWSAASNNSTQPSKVLPGTGNYYPALRPTPPPANSGRATPLSAQGSGAAKAFAPAKNTASDSFSNLVSFGSAKANTLTLQQQQAKLQEEKRRKEEEQRKQYDAQFGSSQFWDGLGDKGKGVAGLSPVPSPNSGMMGQPVVSPFSSTISPPPASNGADLGGDDDLFAAFNKDTKVDNSSHYPPPSSSSSRAQTPGFGTTKGPDLSNPQAWVQPASKPAEFGDDDDPFGLGQMKPPTSAPVPISTSTDDDDFLGDLGKPVEEVKRAAPPIPEIRAESSDSEDNSDDPWDKAVAELVEMGFSAEQSRRALTESGSGLDIQAAVSWLFNDAQKQSKQKAKSRDPNRGGASSSDGQRRETSRDGRKGNAPAWMREEERSQSLPRREENRSPNSESDFTKTAAAMGSNIFKTANSLWKQSQKKIEKAVAEFQADADSSQPKWMREAAEREAISEQRARRAKAEAAKSTSEVTDEALALESGARPSPRRTKASGLDNSRDQSPSVSSFPPERPTSNPRWQQSRPQSRPTPPPVDPRTRVTKQSIEDQSAQAYVSPARRKKATPQPQSQPAPEPDLLFSSSSSQPRPASSQSRAAPSHPTPKSTTSKPSTPTPSKPKPPPRTIPALSPIVLKSSTQHRLEGKAHSDRGDYISAHTSYTSSLSALPQNHPITIFILVERSLTSLKTGHPRDAIQDSDRAISIVGPSRGENESIDLSTGAPNDRKSMKEYWGKALVSKAEALEQLEKWADARDVWMQCIESGVAGAIPIQGRQRCEKALAPKPQRPTPSVTPKPKSRPNMPEKDSEAVIRLREANRKAEKADDEKLMLMDKVDERIAKWRDGKRDNLRALLGSLDKVLWEGSGWKPVGLHELVVPGKVKIAYMKAIGKCHPDKLPQDASQEVRMIAATVFATLNESWDGFKAQNGM